MIANPGKKIQELDARLLKVEQALAELQGKPNPWALKGTTGHDIEPGMPQHPMEKLDERKD